MTAAYAAIVTLLLTVAIIGLALLVSRTRFVADASATATSKVYRVRAVYFVILTAAVVVSLAFTLPMTPYPGKPGAKNPDVVVNVMGEMWSWSLTSGSGGAAAGSSLVLPAGKLVEFDVSSKDVNHNFGIYNSAGELVGQVQAMPDYTNRLFLTFDRPGHYYVLCLEYCGVAHHAMNVEFDVK